MHWHSHHMHLMSKQLPVHSLSSTARNYPCNRHGGQEFSRRGKLLGSVMFTKEFTGLSRRKNPQWSLCSMLWIQTIKFVTVLQMSCPPNFECLSQYPASLLIGLGKEHQDTVKSESLLENQIHRLEKFLSHSQLASGQTTGRLPEPPRRAKLRARCDTLTTVMQGYLSS